MIGIIGTWSFTLSAIVMLLLTPILDLLPLLIGSAKGWTRGHAVLSLVRALIRYWFNNMRVVLARGRDLSLMSSELRWTMFLSYSKWYFVHILGVKPYLFLVCQRQCLDPFDMTLNKEPFALPNGNPRLFKPRVVMLKVVNTPWSLMPEIQLCVLPRWRYPYSFLHWNEGSRFLVTLHTFRTEGRRDIVVSWAGRVQIEGHHSGASLEGLLRLVSLKRGTSATYLVAHRT